MSPVFIMVYPAASGGHFYAASIPTAAGTTSTGRVGYAMGWEATGARTDRPFQRGVGFLRVSFNAPACPFGTPDPFRIATEAIILGILASLKTLGISWQKVQSNAGACGVDGIRDSHALDSDRYRQPQSAKPATCLQSARYGTFPPTRCRSVQGSSSRECCGCTRSKSA